MTVRLQADEMVLTLHECRELFERYTGGPLPTHLPFNEAADYVLAEVGEGTVQRVLAELRACVHVWNINTQWDTGSIRICGNCNVTRMFGR